MAFILTAERHTSPEQLRTNFGRYREYLVAARERFPPSAYRLATSDWYYDPRDHRCPHDSWLEEMVLSEPAQGERSEIRTVSLRVRLLGAYHDGHIELRYPKVLRYDLTLDHDPYGHRDWLYDEFRLTDDNHILHEIEWCGSSATGRWLIEASDVEYTWMPVA